MRCHALIRTIAPITTGQIYWGAAPFVIIQVIMIGLVIAFPGMVLRYKTGELHIDTTNMKIEAPANYGSGGGAGASGPNFGGGSSGTDQGGGTSGPNFNTGQ